MYFWDIENEKAYNNRMGRYKTKSEYDFIAKHSTAGANVLDVGGGSGRFAIPMHDNGHSVTVVDKNPEAINILRERCPYIRAINCDFFDLDFETNEKFDLIMAIEVLLYVENWHAFFAKVNDILAPNGLFVFSATNKSSWRTLLQQQIDRPRKTGAHEYSIYSPADYEKIIRQFSFVIEGVSGFLWIPCSLDSNSRLVEVFAFFERSLSLRRYVRQSPWLMYAARKSPI